MVIQDIAVLESMYLKDTSLSTRILKLNASDNLYLKESFSNLALVHFTANENMYLNHSVQVLYHQDISVSENLYIYDTSNINAIYNISVSDKIIFSGAFTIAGIEYDGWVVNTDNFAVSRYEDYNFNSLCNYKGISFGANEYGVFMLEGDNDDGINIKSSLLTGIIDFDSRYQKRVEYAYIGIKNNGEMLFRTITENNTYIEYPIKTTSDFYENTKLKLGKGVKATSWQFALENVDGSNFDIDSIQLYPIILKRRV